MGTPRVALRDVTEPSGPRLAPALPSPGPGTRGRHQAGLPPLPALTRALPLPLCAQDSGPATLQPGQLPALEGRVIPLIRDVISNTRCFSTAFL